MLKYDSLTAKQKVAILLVSLGQDIAAKIYADMDDHEKEILTLEIASLDVIPPEVRDKVLEEFYEIYLAQQYITEGGLDYARQILLESVGPEKTEEILGKIQKSLHKTGFQLLHNIDSNQLVSFLQNEQPQTIALILAHLNPNQSAGILAALPPEIQPDIAARIATLEQISPEVVQQVENVLETQIATVFAEEYTEAGGVKAVAEILNRVDRATEKNILSAMEREEPELAVEIKNLMFCI